jgi:hypothetical protein
MLVVTYLLRYLVTSSRWRAYRICRLSGTSRTRTASGATPAGPYHEDFVSDRIEAALKSQTDHGQFLIPIDAKTLALEEDSKKGLRVRPEHIHQALREFAGITEHPFSKRFPFVIPEAERLAGLFG